MDLKLARGDLRINTTLVPDSKMMRSCWCDLADQQPIFSAIDSIDLHLEIVSAPVLTFLTAVLAVWPDLSCLLERAMLDDGAQPPAMQIGGVFANCTDPISDTRTT
jgi:hypothetical protein